jgi:hypothetical protein
MSKAKSSRGGTAAKPSGASARAGSSTRKSSRTASAATQGRKSARTDTIPGSNSNSSGTGRTVPSVTVRHYCQGIGDCHLLRFAKSDGSPFFMLIDCGVHSSVSGGNVYIADVVADIATVTKHIDILVLTHEHWDHNSGFYTSAKQFQGFSYGEIWLAWTENPSDPQARRLDKFKGDAVAALQAVSHRLDRSQGLSANLSVIREGLHAVLGFNFGAAGERVRAARDSAVALAPDRVKYLEPGTPPISLGGVSNVRIYVLGPPRDAALIGVTERASEMYGVGGFGGPTLAALKGALGLDDSSDDLAAPFDGNVGWPLDAMLEATRGGSDAERTMRGFVQDYYAGAARAPVSPQPERRTSPSNDTDQSWRTIDHDWLSVSADLAMQLDNRTNNTSLVLAFELVESGRVLLFAADAQVGNWLSWQDLRWGAGDKVVTGPELLARTVYYKVGHHGSHNATLKQKGLEIMGNSDLSAFIPTNQKDALKVKWGQMPFKALLDELERRTGGRIIRADDTWVQSDTTEPRFQKVSGSLRKVTHEKGLWVEVEVG